MKIRLLVILMTFFVSALLIPQGAVADTIPKPGMAREEVRKLLGEPQGRMEMGSSEWWVFPRGRVIFRDGIVTRVELVDAQTFAERQQAAAEERVRLREEGEALKAERLQDLSFLALPAHARLRFWTDFQNGYPDVNVFTQLASARAEVETLDAARRDSQRLADLEWRVREAEIQAQQADQRARDAMNFGRRNTSPQVIVWPTLIPYGHPHIRPLPRSGISISHGRGGTNFQFDSRQDFLFTDRFGSRTQTSGSSRIGW
jgi:hypothetical protein